ncbi:MAG TPA: hypothetical protein DCQ84_07475 [Candidatus Competibacteraceae bacterium]|nr:hypothetical protein [Candidatus Competibacteraceae bacterium]
MGFPRSTSPNLSPLSAIGFWFAWYAFHPETEVYSALTRRHPGVSFISLQVTQNLVWAPLLLARDEF